MMRLRFQLRTLLLLITALALLASYVGSYYRLSRRGMAEARRYGLAGFLYVPVADSDQSNGVRRHGLLTIAFAPLNIVDQQLFGGKRPVSGMIVGLSSGNKKAAE